jgi:hypothetical protein
MSCRLASSFAVFSVNFGASILRTTLWFCFFFRHHDKTDTAAHASQLMNMKKVHQMKIGGLFHHHGIDIWLISQCVFFSDMHMRAISILWKKIQMPKTHILMVMIESVHQNMKVMLSEKRLL